MRTVRLRRILFLLVPILLSAPILRARSYSIESFHSKIILRRDARITVQEDITFRFAGFFRGVHRFIPVNYRTPWGAGYSLHTKLRDVRLENGIRPVFEVDREGRHWKTTIFIPNATDAVRTVTLTYDVWRAVRPFQDHDELYWNVTGNEWDVPINAASAEMVFDAPVSPPEIKAAAYSGVYGSVAQDVAVERGDGVVRFTLPRALGYREGMTIVAGWPKGRVDYPGPLAAALWFLQDNPVLFIPAGVFALCLLIWFYHGRDPVMGSVAPEYTPPAGLTVAEMGSLIDDSVDTRDICAMAVDLAVRGYIRIEELETEVDGKDYFFKKLKEFKDDASLRPFEKHFLSVLFRVSDSRMLYEMKNYFYQDLAELKRQVDRHLIGQGYYLRSPRTVRAAGLVLALAAAAGGVLWGIQSQSLVVFISLSLSAINIGVFGYLMPRKTHRGVRMLEKVLGFQEYLHWAEKDRIRREPPDVFHKWLPYAMAFGVLEQWTKTFEGLTVPAPAWYSSKRAFNPVYFGHRISLMSVSMGNVFASAPRQTGAGGKGWSGRSGFGGGFSGGGFGGGGGGAF